MWPWGRTSQRAEWPGGGSLVSNFLSATSALGTGVKKSWVGPGWGLCGLGSGRHKVPSGREARYVTSGTDVTKPWVGPGAPGGGYVASGAGLAKC